MFLGILGLVLALNSCVHVSGYGFVITNDGTYYDDNHSTYRLSVCRSVSSFRGSRMGLTNVWAWALASNDASLLTPPPPHNTKKATRVGGAGV